MPNSPATTAHILDTFPTLNLTVKRMFGEAALYLAAGASWMTGQTLVLDGGGLISFGVSDEE